MIDTAMLTRLMVLTGFAPPEIPTPKATKEMMALAKAIWAEAQKNEREECAELAEGATAYTQFQTVEHYKIAAAIAACIRMRSNAKVRGAPDF